MERKEIKPGIYPAMSNEDYHRAAGISKSGLDVFGAKNPALYKWRYLDDNEGETTRPMVIGSATHTRVLEPTLYPKHYVVDPGFNRRTKQGKLDAEAFEKDHPGAVILTPSESEIVEGIADSLNNHPTAKHILSKGEAEVSYFAKDPDTGVIIKARPDWETGDILWDLKTCQDASLDEFSKTIFHRRYYLQAAMYVHVVNLAQMEKFNAGRIQNFGFIAVEKKPPYQVALYVVDDDIIFYGLQEFREEIAAYQECLKSGRWPGYNDDKITEIELPPWGLNQLSRRFD